MQGELVFVSRLEDEIISYEEGRESDAKAFCHRRSFPFLFCDYLLCPTSFHAPFSSDWKKINFHNFSLSFISLQHLKRKEITVKSFSRSETAAKIISGKTRDLEMFLLKSAQRQSRSEENAIVSSNQF